MKSSIKTMVIKNKILSKMYIKIRPFLKIKEKKNTQQKLQTNGFDTVHEIEVLLSEKGYVHFFDAGTLLGAIRENGFIKHDLDIDVGVYLTGDQNEDILVEHLTSKGAIHYKRFYVDGIGIIEDTFVMNGIKFDVAYYYSNGAKDYCYNAYKLPGEELEKCMRLVKIYNSHINEFIMYPFGNFEISIPKEYEKFLVERYGENWRIPDNSFIYWKGPNTELCDGIVYNR